MKMFFSFESQASSWYSNVLKILDCCDIKTRWIYSCGSISFIIKRLGFPTENPYESEFLTP